MAKFNITQTTTVAELKSQFSQEIGGVLRIYEGRSEASEASYISIVGSAPKGMGMPYQPHGGFV